MQQIKNHRKVFIAFSCLFSLIILLNGCRTISGFHQETFTRTSALKARTIVLMKHATEDYKTWEQKVDELWVEAETIYAIQKARARNNITLAQWNLLMGNENKMLPGFFREWESKGKLSAFFVNEQREQIGQAFDEILKLEAAKLRY